MRKISGQQLILILASIFFLAFTNNSMAQDDYKKYEEKCLRYGFTKGTNEFAQCIQKEAHQSEGPNSCVNLNKLIKEKKDMCESNCRAKSHIWRWVEQCRDNCIENLDKQIPFNCR